MFALITDFICHLFIILAYRLIRGGAGLLCDLGKTTTTQDVSTYNRVLLLEQTLTVAEWSHKQTTSIRLGDHRAQFGSRWTNHTHRLITHPGQFLLHSESWFPPPPPLQLSSDSRESAWCRPPNRLSCCWPPLQPWWKSSTHAAFSGLASRVSVSTPVLFRVAVFSQASREVSSRGCAP